MSIQVDHVTKRFGSFTVLNDVEPRSEGRGRVALPSALPVAARPPVENPRGLERPDQGRILLHDIEVTNQRITDRRVDSSFSIMRYSGI